MHLCVRGGNRYNAVIVTKLENDVRKVRTCVPVVSKGVTDIWDGVKVCEDNRCQIASVDNDVLGLYVDWGLFYAATMFVVEMPVIWSWKQKGDNSNMCKQLGG